MDGLRFRGLLVVLGALLLASAIALGFTGLTDTYEHDVTAIEDQSAETELSGQVITDPTVPEQAVVLEAAATADTVWRGEPVGLRFEYPSGQESTRYIVEVENNRYILETAQRQRPVTMLTHGLRVSFAIAGPLLLLSGGIPLLGTLLYPNMVLTDPFETFLYTWAPVWAGIILAPAGIFCLVFPVILETIGPVPLNLFVTPFGIATSLCAGLTMLLLKVIDVPNGEFLLSVLNLPVIWAILTALVVGPSKGEASATLTVFLGNASLSVIVGLALGWYTRRWLKMKRSDYPYEPEYWRI